MNINVINNNCSNGFKLDEEYFNIRGEKVLISNINNKILKLYYDINNCKPTLLIKESNKENQYFNIGEIQKRRSISYLQSLTALITEGYINSITNDSVNLDFDEADEILTGELIII